MKPLLTRGINRRRLLASAVSAGVATLSFAYPGLARVVTVDRGGTRSVVPAPAAFRDPTFWTGVVTGKTANSLEIATVEGARIVRIPAGSLVWKEFDLPITSVDIGDSLMVKGEPQPDGSLRARPGWVWANGASWDATLLAPRPGGFLVKRHRDQAERSLLFSKRLEVITAVKQRTVPEGTGALVTGMTIGAVGLVLPDGNLRATRIWIYGR